MKTISDICNKHRTKTYFDDGGGLIGVFNHRNVVLWYRRNLSGYCLVGETLTSENGTKRKIV